MIPLLQPLSPPPTLTITLHAWQFNLFFEMPFMLEFPGVLFLVCFLLSVFAAIGGSYYASVPLKKKCIASILKGS